MSMTVQELLPTACPVDVVLDTDAYNEVDDQFAIAYLLRSAERLHTKAIYAAPFLNVRSVTPRDGMEKSYREICHLLSLMDEQVAVFRGSEQFLTDEKTPVISPAARDLAERAMDYAADKPLYVVAIGAITNVASALLINPEIAERIVVVWLGGHAHHYHDTKEFNLFQDVAAARVVMGSGVRFVQLPCRGVVDMFALSRHEIVHYFEQKNPLCGYLLSHTVAQLDEENGGAKDWSKPLWDVTAVAWLLLGAEERTFGTRIVPIRLPKYDGTYDEEHRELKMAYVYHLRRDPILRDFIPKLTK